MGFSCALELLNIIIFPMTALALLSSFIIFPSTGLEHKSSYRVVPYQGICSVGEIRGVYIVIKYITFHIFFVTRQLKYIRVTCNKNHKKPIIF